MSVCSEGRLLNLEFTGEEGSEMRSNTPQGSKRVWY